MDSKKTFETGSVKEKGCKIFYSLSFFYNIHLTAFGDVFTNSGDSREKNNLESLPVLFSKGSNMSSAIIKKIITRVTRKLTSLLIITSQLPVPDFNYQYDETIL